MSDRVTNAEVEDVLSSIRRLVSEDNRAPGTRTALPPSATPRPGRLVLTPALRVLDPEGAPTTTKADSQAEPSVTQRTQPQDTSDEVITENVPEPPKVSDAKAFDSADDPTEQFPKVEDDVEATAPGELHHASVTQTAAKAEPDQEETDVEPASPLKESTDYIAGKGIETSDAGAKAAELSSKIAALETAIGKISDTWEPDDPGESDYAGTTLQEMEWEDEPADKSPFQRPVLAPVMRKLEDDDALEDNSTTTPVDEAEPVEVSHGFSSQRKTTLPPFPADEVPEPAMVLSNPEWDVAEPEAEEASVEAQFLPQRDIAEPAEDLEVSDVSPALSKADAVTDPLPTELEEDEVVQKFVVEDHAPAPENVVEDIELELVTDDWQDEALATPTQERLEDTAAQTDTPQDEVEDDLDEGMNIPEEDQLLDEAALRELVGDIVRSELQGALGERITRNVRKLVRREIHRALTAQELE